MGKILIIDDDSQYAAMLKEIAGPEHDAMCCGTLQAGCDALASFAPDVVLLDVCLPDGNGLDRIHDIKLAACLPEILVITGSGNQDAAETAIRCGVWGYWQKGRSIKELLSNVGLAMDYRAQHRIRRDWQGLDLSGFVGDSQAMTVCFELIAKASAGDVPVLVSGETGTGKEMVARAIHQNSIRAKKPFVVVDCASLTESLVESSLFGHDRGAFTGASGDRAGLIRQAHEGTLFLDEIGELPLSMQRAFLRVLQEKRFRPVGSDREVTSDFRVLAATNRDLARMVQDGTFREDLYFRLRSLEIVLPPLRGRGQDARAIAEDVAVKTCERLGLPNKRLSDGVVEALTLYPWPGNVRELRQAVECAVVTAGDALTIEAVHLPIQIRIHLARAAVKPELNRAFHDSPRGRRGTLAATRDAAVSAYLAQLIEDVRGDVDLACEIADVSRSRFYGLLKLYGIGRSASIKAGAACAALAELSCRLS